MIFIFSGSVRIGEAPMGDRPWCFGFRGTVKDPNGPDYPILAQGDPLAEQSHARLIRVRHRLTILVPMSRTLLCETL